MSEFDKRFPKQKNYYGDKSTNEIHRKGQREGWLEHGKLILNLIQDKHYSKAWIEEYLEKEIEELSK